ncbi:hypothetical protein AS033_10215 [Exiguobacterium indicum]|uniref:CRISPR-associated endoribonuclease Cas2 n=1 Tax=Exiguobacterium indicum TaxID=296995 RepID=A0A0V8GEI6_9BACL|nr:CRISPR-associated endonuclease Cas2 [Exiguobacterium enclense]KSU48697.1 hypothetical protein AS033_10215 [Exiguobacterium enclense]SDC80977.1 CRISPR-associated protein Cas2 [Exiguobacterium enclense]
MKVIAVYDMDAKRGREVRKICSRYLNPVQRSVFEGELTERQYKELRDALRKYIREEDQLVFYIVRNPKWLRRDYLGIPVIDFWW